MSELEKVGFSLNYDFYFRSFNAEIKVIVFVMNHGLKGTFAKYQNANIKKWMLG